MALISAGSITNGNSIGDVDIVDANPIKVAGRWASESSPPALDNRLNFIT
jgi:hypothetical protein